LYATTGKECFKITSDECKQVPSLQCNQEEADTRLLLHAAHAAKDGFKAVVICSEDTIMLLAFHEYQKCGTKIRKRIIYINNISSSVGIFMCKALIGMNAFTGCDTVSAFAGKGKSKALKMLINNKDHQDTFAELGREWDVSMELMNKLEHFTCLLYAPKTSSTNVNELRYHLFCAKKVMLKAICFHLAEIAYTLQLNYQASIWRIYLEQYPNIPSPEGRGWRWMLS